MDPDTDPDPVIPPTGPWAARGACRGLPPAIFFPEPTAGRGAPGNARIVCAGCPVLDECREWAIPIVALKGIWGGQTEDERKNERRRRANPAPVIVHGIRSTYVKHGCRCDACRQADRDYSATPQRQAYNRRRMADYRAQARAQRVAS